jgi:hypothetical protein
MSKIMQFKVRGTKALWDELDIDVHELMTMKRSTLRYLQQSRVTHAVNHRYVTQSFNVQLTMAVIEIEGVFPN